MAHTKNKHQESLLIGAIVGLGLDVVRRPSTVEESAFIGVLWALVFFILYRVYQPSKQSRFNSFAVGFFFGRFISFLIVLTVLKT
jgi:tetrahydromethanopterin S-methyltransferase subunit D